MLSTLLTPFRAFGRRLADEDRGAGLVEYTLLVALIAIVCFGAMTFLGGSGEGSLDNSKSCLEAAYGGTELPEGCD